MMASALAIWWGCSQREPGDDVTTRLLHHQAALTDEEMVHQLLALYGAGIEPMLNLVSIRCG